MRFKNKQNQMNIIFIKINYMQEYIIINSNLKFWIRQQYFGYWNLYEIPTGSRIFKILLREF